MFRKSKKKDEFRIVSYQEDPEGFLKMVLAMGTCTMFGVPIIQYRRMERLMARYSETDPDNRKKTNSLRKQLKALKVKNQYMELARMQEKRIETEV